MISESYKVLEYITGLTPVQVNLTATGVLQK
jgi:hypothetical protein